MERNVKTFSNEICYRGHIISNGGIFIRFRDTIFVL